VYRPFNKKIFYKDLYKIPLLLIVYHFAYTIRSHLWKACGFHQRHDLSYIFVVCRGLCDNGDGMCYVIERAKKKV